MQQMPLAAAVDANDVDGENASIATPLLARCPPPPGGSDLGAVECLPWRVLDIFESACPEN